MIKLIKNEFVKLFHKKAIYILMFLTILLIGFETFITKINKNFDYSDEEYYSKIGEDSIKNKEYAQKFIDENRNHKLLAVAICYDSKEKEHKCVIEEI